MTRKIISFSSGSTNFYFDASLDDLTTIAPGKRLIFITDSNVFGLHKRKFAKKDTIVVPAGEQHKTQATVDFVIGELVKLQADRSTMVVGVGGGVVTDIAGYVAAIYMRGIDCGFVATTILAMVDAAIGGKNGVDVGIYKNIVGTIRQPSFLLYDYRFLKTLPHTEWVNGFAEVIKHAAIKDAAMFKQLQLTTISKLKRDSDTLQQLIQRNAMIKVKVVQQDEFEKGDRKLLNFGHTLGHAIEKMLQLPHGWAISIGMVYASHLSSQLLGYKQALDIISLLEKFELPTHADFEMDQAIANIMMDKKRKDNMLHFVLLEKTGKAVVKPIEIETLKQILIKA
jgi:3-dehydroquinate synthase